MLCKTEPNVYSVGNVRFSSEGKDSLFIAYYQCKEQNKL